MYSLMKVPLRSFLTEQYNDVLTYRARNGRNVVHHDDDDDVCRGGADTNDMVL